MNKNERKSRLKEIIRGIDVSIESINGSTRKLMTQFEEKLDDLTGFLNDNCIVPDDYDEAVIFTNVFADIMDNDEDLGYVFSSIEELKDDVDDHISDMNEGVRREEWEDFSDQLDGLVEEFDIQEQGIESLDDYIERLKNLKITLNDLM